MMQKTTRIAWVPLMMMLLFQCSHNNTDSSTADSDSTDTSKESSDLGSSTKTIGTDTDTDTDSDSQTDTILHTVHESPVSSDSASHESSSASDASPDTESVSSNETVSIDDSNQTDTATVTHTDAHDAADSSTSTSSATDTTTLDSEDAGPGDDGGQGDNRPNLIIVYTDDQQYNGLGANGNDLIITPNMDQLSEQGIRFTAGSVVTSLCSPSRAALLTGRFNHANGVEGLSGPLNSDEVTIAHYLKDAGYQTATIGKWHIDTSPSTLGFDFVVRVWGNGEYYDRQTTDNGNTVYPPEHVDSYCANRAIDFVTSAKDQGAPFFLFHNTQAPHWINRSTWPVLDETLALYDVNEMPVPDNHNDDLTGKPSYLANENNVQTGINNGYDDPQTIQEEVAHYYSAITEMDVFLGRLFDAVEALGLLSNTYIVVMSDNGWFLAEHGMGGKVLAYEPSLRVPMFIVGPDINPSVSDALVQNIDVTPTLLDIAGLPIPGNIHGKSLLPILTGVTTDVRDIAIYETLEGYGGTHPLLGAFDKQHKVIQTRMPEDLTTLEFGELYDIVNDPGEMSNVWDDPNYNDIQARLNSAIDHHTSTILGW